ncbi:DNA-binding CsgD family transcriptional regulator [Rhizobium ruizarguesonis]
MTGSYANPSLLCDPSVPNLPRFGGAFFDLQRATRVIGLSQAQTRLARLIVDGHDLAAASELLGAGVNTLRTQLRRIFDKTGVRSQAALVRTLLSAGAPSQ